jgi:hypothetical protein
MLFLNPWMLLALAGVAIPVVIHLMRRRAAEPMDWGAMRFLRDSVSERRRRIEWEDLLLMAARCLLLALVALAVARPFVPPGANVAWSFVLISILLAAGAFGASFVASGAVRRGALLGAAVAMLAVAAALVWFERSLNMRRFETSGRRDVALVIDASSSMGRETDRGSLFEQAVAEARQIVGEAPRGTSFVVVLGGPAPQAMSSTPLAHRADVLGQLDELRMVGGGFRAHEALGVATLALAEGEHASKQIIVFTDGQRHGWRFGDAGAWKSLDEAWRSLPTMPKLLLRLLPAPEKLRNVGIAGIETSRRLIGRDRPVTVRVSVENTGTEALAPGGVTLEVDGKSAGREALGVLVPGQRESVEFRHRFRSAGPGVVTARLEGRDELPEDDRADRVVVVRDRVRVLLVDGNPSGNFFDRAAGPAALALAPTAALLAGKKVAKNYLMDPKVVGAPDLREVDIEGADVVVLADVTRLPSKLAGLLSERVAEGGGLIVAAGPRSDPAFYNAWTGPAGPVLPLALGGEGVSEAGVSPAPATFRHESLDLFHDEGATDLGRAVVYRWRKAREEPGRGVVGASFSNGDPFLAGQSYGAGRCLLAACAFDRRAGGLPARTSFVPLVHELVSWVASGGMELNVKTSWSPAVMLGRGGGLVAQIGSLSRDRHFKAIVERVDSAIDFNWGSRPLAKGVPREHCGAIWTGRLLPPIDGEYVFDAEANDRVSMKLGGRTLLSTGDKGRASGRTTLEAGKPMPVEVRYENYYGRAFVRLFWTPPGGTRSIVPPFAWLPPRGVGEESLSAVDPLGQSRKALVSVGRKGRPLKIEGPAVPGLYQVGLTESVRKSAPGLAAVKRLPVVVVRDIRESRPDPMQAADFEEMRAVIDTMEPGGAEDVLAVLSGRGFGREITRVAAFGALALLVLETMLARWVSRSRRAGEAESIDFGSAAPVNFGRGGGL